MDPRDSHVLTVTWELGGELEWGRCGQSPPDHLSVFQSHPAPMDLRGPRHGNAPHRYSSGCRRDGSSRILILTLAISPPASFQPAALRTGFMCL